MCIRSMGSRRDCTEAFLSTTSAASPPRLWPLPPMSSWSRCSTWTSRRFYTSRVSQGPLCSKSQINLDASIVEWCHLVRLKLFNMGITLLSSSLKAPGKSLDEKGNRISESKTLQVCPISFLLTSCFCESPPLKRSLTQTQHVAWIWATPSSMWIQRISDWMVGWLRATICSLTYRPDCVEAPSFAQMFSHLAFSVCLMICWDFKMYINLKRSN